MYKMFRKVVEKIIVKEGNVSLEEFYQKDQFSIMVEKEIFLPFHISREGDTLYVGFYRNMNGDAVSDPIFVFKLKDDVWHPIRVEQVLGTSEIGMFEHGRYYYYPGQFKDVRSFATVCSKEWKFYYL